MPSTGELLYLLVRPAELRSIIQWKVWHTPVHERTPEKESPTLRRCFYFLDKTSRSFSAVIKELHPDLLVPVCVFYLILRGLDTIEDDMSIPLETKEPILRGFDKTLDEAGWKFEGNHPRERDRDLLVEFDCVITEFAKIKRPYQNIIRDITKRMGDGMAEYCNNAEHNANGVNTIEDYEMYCHYVAGLVGEGLTRLFVESGLANPALIERPELHESMGQFLQQVNIIRDIKEDEDDKRRFWPKEIWSKHVDNFEDLLKPEFEPAALNCSSEMVLNALERADECLFYLAGLRDQSVFNFCAIPQSMAIATLHACFRNPQLFKKNVKITKGQACQLMIESTGNLRMVCDVFRRYARAIHKKSDPKDPNFLKISIVCGKIEQFIETLFPSQKAGAPANQLSPEQAERKRKDDEEAKWEIIYMSIAVLGVLAFVTIFMLAVAWMAGARFDIALDQLRQGKILPPSSGEEARKIVKSFGHGEL